MFIKKYLILLLTICITFICIQDSQSQSGRRLWGSDAYVEGDFQSNSGIFDTIKSASYIFSVSNIYLNIGNTITSDSGKALIYDATTNAINLLPITDYLDFATVGSSLNFNDISDVSVEWASEGWVPAWNSASEIWEATPAATTSGSTGITESEIATLIEAATTSLTFDEISNVSMAAKIDGVIPYWNAAESVWDATPQASGGTSTGGASALSELTDVSLSSPTSGQVLGYNGSAWINTAAGGGASPATIVIAAADSLDTSGAHYICDGVSDEIEINAALTKLAGIGGSIYLMSGTYNIASTISVTSTVEITMRGDGKASILKRAFASSDQRVHAVMLVHGSPGKTRISLDSLAFDGVSSVYTSNTSTLIYFGYSGNPGNIHNCHFYNTYYGIALGDGSAKNFAITSSVFTSCVYGIDMHGGTSNSNIEISNNNFESCTNGIFCVYGGNTIIASNGFLNCVESIDFNSFRGTGVISNNVVVGNTGTYAIQAGGSSGSFGKIVSNNNIYAPSGKGIRITDGDCALVTGNRVINPGDDGIVVDLGAHNTTVDSNLISGAVDEGILVYNCQNAVVKNNSVYSSGGTGIYFDAVSATGTRIVLCTGNLITGGSDSGIYLTNTSSTTYYIEHNTIRSNQINQISIRARFSDSPTVHIKNNSLFGTDAEEALVSLEMFYASGNPSTYLGGNTCSGLYSDIATSETYSGNSWEIYHTNSTTDNGGVGNVIIASSSSTACIGFATDELTSIDHVITVAPDATTNPIATSWDTWSLPELKSGIASVSDDKKRSSVGNIGALKLIEYDWKYNEPEPVIAKEDIGTATETIIRQGWEKRKVGWERQKNKVKSWSADITDPSFPADLGSYNAEGKLTGINNTAVIWRLVGAVQELQAEVERLKFGGKN